VNEQWLSNGAGVLLIVGGLTFLFKYFWPWYRDVYWPTRHARDREQYDQLVNLNDRLLEGLEKKTQDILTGLEQKTQAIMLGQSNVSDGIEHIQGQARELDDNQNEFLAQVLGMLGNSQDLVNLVKTMEAQNDVTSRKLERFDEILTSVSLAYLSDRTKEKEKQ
jgi:hypothetical protein